MRVKKKDELISLKFQLWSDLHRNRPKPETSLPNQAQASNFCRSRPETGTSTGAGPSQGPPPEQVQVSNLHGTRPKPATATRAEPNQ